MFSSTFPILVVALLLRSSFAFLPTRTRITAYSSIASRIKPWAQPSSRKNVNAFTYHRSQQSLRGLFHSSNNVPVNSTNGIDVVHEIPPPAVVVQTATEIPNEHEEMISENGVVSLMSHQPHDTSLSSAISPLLQPIVPTPNEAMTTVTDEESSNYKLVLYDLTRAGLLGVITGASVAAFKLLIESLRLEAYSLPFLVEPLVAALVPAFGGLVVGLLALFGTFPPGLRGIIKETDRDSKALFSDNDTQFKPFAFLRKTVAAIFTLGTGCSLGPEGPSVEIGVNLSRSLTASLKNQIPTSNLSEVIKHNRLLLSCGGAAGVAAGFNAPIAGIFFALEVIQGTFSSIGTPNINNNVNGGTGAPTDSGAANSINENLMSTKGGISSIVLSAVLAALISKTLLGDELVFKVTEYSLKTPLLELPLYLLLGSLCGVFAFAFSQLSNGSKQLFDGELGPEPLRDSMTAIPSVAKPVLGGLFCGLVGIAYPQILFFGYETLNNLLTKTSLSTELLLTLLAVKMVTTSVASGSGLVGGTFAPSLFFGGMLGASFHNVFEYLFQSYGDGLAELPAYAMIGSASVLAALFRAPLTASLLLFECTREYEIILPLMASAGLASVVADVLELWSTQQQDSSEKNIRTEVINDAMLAVTAETAIVAAESSSTIPLDQRDAFNTTR